MLVEVTAAPEIAKFQSERKEMLSVTNLTDKKRQVRINSSSLSILQECKRKSFYSLIMELQARREGAATVYGTAMHKGMETLYIAPASERKMPPRFQERIDLMAAGAPPEDDENDWLLLRVIRAFITAAQELRFLPDSDKRSITTGVWTLSHYLKTYLDDPYEIYRDASGPMVERKAEHIVYDSDDLQIVLFGTIDCILHNVNNKTILVCDHKTSSVVGEQFYNRLKPNHQYTGYVLLAQKTLGINTDKFMVNCIQVKAKPVTARGQAPHFPRQVTTRSDEDIAEFIETLVYYVKEFLACKEGGIWPLGHVGVCSSYNGCQYMKICASPKSIRDNIIRAEFYGSENEGK